MGVHPFFLGNIDHASFYTKLCKARIRLIGIGNKCCLTYNKIERADEYEKIYTYLCRNTIKDILRLSHDSFSFAEDTIS